MKYYIIAGEASGDLHGSNLVRSLQNIDVAANIRAWGGEQMQAAGAAVVKHYKDLAFMGFAEVLKNLPTIFANFKFCKNDITRFAPDVLVLIDYPGFNLRIAKWAKSQGLKVVYYISPQVWAWKANRVKLIRRVVDKMLVILPFEKDYYHQKWAYEVSYVGHPLVQVVQDFLNTAPSEKLFQKPIVALLPGSRQQEVAVKLPLMLTAAKAFPGYQFVVAKAPALPHAFYQGLLSHFPDVALLDNQTYRLLSQATAALVTSGTATLETALFGVPQVVCYKGSAISYHIARRLVNIRYISLVNLIMDRPVVTELIQNELTVANIEKALRAILFDAENIARIKADYGLLKKLLQQGGRASEAAAAEVFAIVSGE